MSTSNTPRTDKEVSKFTEEEDAMICPEFARQLEVELNEAKEKIKNQRERIRRLEGPINHGGGLVTVAEIESKLKIATDALVNINRIQLQYNGHDWCEIEQAKEIATDALKQIGEQ